MNMRDKGGVVALTVVALAVGVLLGLNLLAPGAGVDAGPAKGNTPGRYTVIHTEGTNLAVTDNQANVLYFYTIDPGEDPGAALKLRGTVDLGKVGQPQINPTLVNPI